MAIQKITADVISSDAITTASISDSAITAAKLAGTLDLTGKTITIATASSGDNDTSPASTAFVQQEISALVDSSPDALNTLNELAAALGDDANFSTTVTNSIATKLPLAGGALTGNLSIGDSSSRSFALYIENAGSAGAGQLMLVDSDNDTLQREIRTDAGVLSFDYWDSSNRSNHLTILANGNVGIGTTNPTADLSVGSTSTSSGDVHLRTTKTAFSITPSNTDAGGILFDLGWVNGGQGPMRFGINASEKMRIDSSGNVGIGTDAPAAPLDVQGSTGLFMARTSSGLASYIENDGGYAAQYLYQIGGSAKVAFHANGSSYFNGGNVGIGTTSPLNKLSVVKSNTSNYYNRSDATVVIQDALPTLLIAHDGNNTNDYAELRLGNNQTTYYPYSAYIRGVQNSGIDRYRLEFGTSSFATASTKMTISELGNVGIGTTNPQAKLNTNLQVEGSILAYMSGTSLTFDGGANVAVTHSSSALGSGTAGGLLLANNNNSNGAPSPLIAFSARSASSSYNHTYATIHGEKTSSGADTNWNTGALIFSTSSGTGPNERMRITKDGNLLINTTSKTSFPTNAGAAAFGAGGEVNLKLSSYGAAHTYQQFILGGSVVGSISSTTSTTSYNQSSDYRLKENVVEMTGALDRVNQLQPKRFNFIADADTTVDGFLAHEVQDIVPEAITGEKDAVDDEGNPEYQGIDHSKLVPLLTKAIQEQQTIIDDLKSRIETLEG